MGPSSGPKKGKRKVEAGDRLFVERKESTIDNDKKRRKRKYGEHDDETLKEFDQSDVREMLSKEGSMKVEYFHLANAHEGMLLYGCVREIRGLQLSISLPHCQSGQVQANQISEEYTRLIKAHINDEGDTDELATLDDMFQVGDFVVCSVLKTDGAHLIPLTLYPSVVNKYLSTNDFFVGKSITGSVKSEEDHGYVINTGKATINAFLPIKECGEKRFKIGSVIRTTITDIRGGGKILMLGISEKLLESVVRVNDVASLDTLQPGTVGLFKCSSVDTVGMIGKFLGFNASITVLNYDEDNLKNSSSSAKSEMAAKKKKLSARKKKNVVIPAEGENVKDLKCCVLYVNPLTKHVVLCANAFVLNIDARRKFLSNKLAELPQGMKCKVQLTKTIHGLGAVFQLDDGLKGFCHLKNLNDNKFVDFSQTFGEMKQFDARIIQSSTVDGVVDLSLKKSIVDNEYYTYDNIMPGTLVECTIESFKEKGVWVRIGNTIISPIKGFLNNIHLADVILKHPDRVFSVGDVISCRVLNVDKNRERVRVTHKKTLVKTKLPIITEYEQLKENMIVHAYIATIKEYGVFIKLYNNIQGFVPKQDLAVKFVDDPLKTFYVGQIVKCRVLFCHPDEEKARFSLILKPKETRARQAYEQQKVQTVKVTEKTDDGLRVASCNGEGRGFLPKMHLSDFPSIAKGWFSMLSEGDTIEGCLLVNAKQNIFTKKDSIIQCHVNPTTEHKDLSFDDLVEDLISVGFIYKHESFGVFVQLPGGLVGLCPISKMSDKYLFGSAGYFVDGQTVVCKVLEIDTEKKRFLLSLKESDTSEFKDMSFCYSIDKYAHAFSNLMTLSNCKWDQGLGLGKIFHVTVFDNDHEDGRLCSNEKFPEGFSAILLDAGNIKEKTVDAVMLHVDLSSRRFVLSADTTSYNATRQLKPGSVLSWNVKFLNEDVATVLAESDSKRVVAVTMARSSPVQSFLLRKDECLKTGRDIWASITASNSDSLYVAKCNKRNKVSIRQNDVDLKEATSKLIEKFEINSDTYFGNLKVGQTVKGVISSIRATHLLVRIGKEETGGGFRGNPITARLHYSELANEPLENHFSMKEFQCWSEISGNVIGFRDVETHRFLAITNRNSKRCVVDLSRREDPVKLRLDMLNVGDKVTTYFKKYMKNDEEMHVEATPAVTGRIPLLLLSTEPQSTLNATKNCYKPYAAHCIVHKVFSTQVLFAVKGALVDRNTQGDVNTVNAGCVTNGRVRRVFENRLVVKLPDGVVGEVHITNSADDFSEDVFKGLKQHDIVRCSVLECIDRKNAVLSMRQSHQLPDSTPPEIKDPAINNGKEISVGMKLRGFITSVSKSGVFVALSPTVSARATLENVSKYFISDLNKVSSVFKIGYLVTCKVLSVTEIEGKVSVSLLENDTGLADLVPESLELPLRTGKKGIQKEERSAYLVDKVEGRKSRIQKINNKAKKINLKKGQSDDADSGLDEEMLSVETQGTCKITINNPDIDPDDPGFSLEPMKTTNAVLDDSSSDEEEEEEVVVAPPRKKTKLEIKLEEKKREDKIRREEERLLENDTPQTTEEWDKLAISSPQNSFVWVGYMTFHLMSSETELARAVAERALKTIDFSEEKERWNIWVSLLNLESKFGDEHSLVKTMGRACQHNDPLKVNLHMVSLYEKSGKMTAAEELCEKMTKKFRQNKTVWMLYISHLVQRGMRKKAKEIFKRSLQSLEKNIHLEVISKFAQLEYKFGDPEHGRVLFENALANYPRRADIWSIYIDMLIKSNLTNDVRDVLERVTTMNFSTKNMRSFFKRYVEFESKFGSEKLVAEVKQKALEYIQSKTDLED